MKVKVERMGINGEGIAFQNRQPIFIDGALPNEVVDIKIVEKQRNFSKGQIIKILQRSEDRIRKVCEYANECGGCALMHVNYEKQLEYKYDLLKEALVKYARINPKVIEKVVRNPHPFEYRNSFKLPFSMHNNTLVCGLYKPKTNYFVPVKTCAIHERDLERVKKGILKVLNQYDLKAYNYKTKVGMRTLVARGFAGKYQVCIVSGNDEIPQSCIDELMQIKGIVSLWQNINTVKKSVDLFGKVMVHLAGERLLSFTLNDLKLTLSPKSFFQLNTLQAMNLYDKVASLVDKKVDYIVEAYSGIGAISLYLKDKANEILGIEYISDAVANANQNAKRNHAKHVSFVCGDAAQKLTAISKKRSIDVLVVDPPRSGLDDAMLDCIMRSKIKKVIYISCNPSTLGKNLGVLQGKYRVESITPYDMFSQTPHIESIVELVRNK